MNDETDEILDEILEDAAERSEMAEEASEELTDEEETEEAEEAEEDPAAALEAEQERYLRLYAEFDNFRKRTAKEKQYHSGIVMILNQLRAFLEKTGVTEVESLGAAFDPKVHNAIKQAEATEEFPEGTICEVFQKGYLYKDRLIRPAMVAVAG